MTARAAGLLFLAVAAALLDVAAAETAFGAFGAAELDAQVARGATAGLAARMACEAPASGLRCWRRDHDGWRELELESALESAQSAQSGDLEDLAWDLVAGAPHFVQVSCAASMCCALDNLGFARCWDPTGDERMRLGDRALVQVAVGHSQVCGLRASDFGVSCWPLSRPGQPMHRTEESVPARFGHISCGKEVCCAVEVSARGRIQCWNGAGEPDLEAPRGVVFSQVVVGQGGRFVVGVERGTKFIRVWGEDSYGQVSTAPRLVAVDHVACGSHFCCALLASDAGIKCWGRHTALHVDASLAKLENFDRHFLVASATEVCVVDPAGSMRGCLPWHLDVPSSANLLEAQRTTAVV